MVMITFLGASVKEYLDCYGEKSPDFPADCPICGSCKPHRHGHFDRWAVDADSEIQIPIYRYLCQAENKVEGQDKTISLLPNFLWPFRCMLSEFVEKAVCLRVDDRLSWDELVDILNSRPGLVSGKTVRRWVNALAKTFAEVHTKLLSLLLKYFPGLRRLICRLACLWAVFLDKPWLQRYLMGHTLLTFRCFLCYTACLGLISPLKSHRVCLYPVSVLIPDN